ncbi:MAG: DNA translocase FtsK 4TM domain-containing protein, partial [Patescibacteria group bacterium]
MARRKRREREQEEINNILRIAAAIALIAFGLILALSGFGLGGVAGGAAFSFFFYVLGVGSILVPLLMVVGGVALFRQQLDISPTFAGGSTLIILSALALLGILSETMGGVFGSFLGGMAHDFFGLAGALVLLLAFIAIGLIIATDIVALLSSARELLGSAGGALSNVQLPSLPKREKNEEEDEIEEEPQEEEEHKQVDPVVTVFNSSSDAPVKAAAIPNFDAEYKAPPTSLLGDDKGKPGVGDIKANANIIKRTFLNFGISVEMDEVSVGPTVTRYAIKPAEGVRLSKIISLQNNLELALASHPVRIEAPIPGKSLVGIEVPNASKATVGLGGLLNAPEWSNNDKPLLSAVGRDITGTPHYVNIGKMPHGLVAGATGSGKSVAIHALITSLLYRNGPNQLRFIMVDPKRVELTLYNGIPHLLTPVITDPKKCIMALKWAAKEMERRYNILEAEQVRDIDSYHATVYEPAKRKKQAEMPESMPYIVVVIDELADIMQSYPRELEAGIVRLAQMSRAVGIHLLLSTQRPSVNV